MTPDAFDPQLQAGARLGPYELGLELGRGGMGAVWLARNSVTRELVALKILLFDPEANPRYGEMFRDELLLANHLGRRLYSLCSATAWGESDGIVYLVLDYVEGASLADIDAIAPIPGPELLTILERLAAALADFHGLEDSAGRPLNAAHRDVTTHNVMVTLEGDVRLIDFGISKFE